MSLTQTNIEIITRIDFESVSNGIKWYQMISNDIGYNNFPLR